MRDQLKISRLLLLAFVAQAVLTAETQARPIRVPCGAAAAVDGKFELREWNDAARAPLGAGSVFMTKVSGGNLFAAVKLPRASYRYVDLYVRDSTGRLLNLHASFKQGQRLLTPGWSDDAPPFEWSPKGWDSSIAQRTGAAGDAPIANQIEGLEGYEVRVPLAALGRPPLKIRVEVRDFEGQGKDWVYPAGSTRDAPHSWADWRASPSCK